MLSEIHHHQRHNSVRLFRDGQRLALTDNDMMDIGGDFVVRHLRSAPDADHGYRIDKETESLLRPPDHEWRPNAGCIEALRFVATESMQNYEFASAVSFRAPNRNPNVEVPKYPAIGRFVEGNERGLMRTAAGVSQADVILAIEQQFPDSRIVVIGNNAEKLRACATKVNHAYRVRTVSNSMQCVTGTQPYCFFDAQGEASDGFDDDLLPFPNLVACTPLQLITLEPSTIDVAIVLDAEEVTIPNMRVALSKNDAPFRLFGLLKEDARISDYESAHISAAFGFAILDLSSNGRSMRPAMVKWISNRQHPVSGKSAVSYPTIIHNSRRNRHIKQSALGWNHEGRDLRVCVLVDRIDHASALAEMMPDWRIVTNEQHRLDGLKGKHRNRLKRNRKRDTDGMRNIVMTDAAKQLPLHPDVIVWAGGGSADQIPASWLASRTDFDQPVLIIDFLDEFNRATREFSAKRRRAYADRDIFEYGVFPREGRVRRFVNKYWRPTR